MKVTHFASIVPPTYALDNPAESNVAQKNPVKLVMQENLIKMIVEIL